MLTKPPINNWLLQSLPAGELEDLALQELVDLPLRTTLEQPGEAVEFVYFIESGVASMVLSNVGGKPIEVGLVGYEGLVGTGVALGDRVGSLETYMQVAGNGYRIAADQFVAAMGSSAPLRERVLRYSRALSIQVAATASANGRAKLEERLSRWLVMISDRTGASFQITHEFIAVMLGVRRSGVTLALAALEGERLIRASRGLVTIVDREGLIEEAAGSYGLAEREYARLLPGPHADDPGR
jgi:CRP-like cAMP-binding protein